MKVETLLIWFVSLCIGVAIGARKNQTVASVLLVIFLGPIGALITFLLPSNFPKCSACKGNVMKGATKCKNCGIDLRWA